MAGAFAAIASYQLIASMPAALIVGTVGFAAALGVHLGSGRRHVGRLVGSPPVFPSPEPA